jgi:hypothetical protein
MSSKLLIAPDREGRKSGLRRLVYRPQTQSGKVDSDWQSTKDRLRRTVARVPEVVIKVTGGGSESAGVLRYMNYISRNGTLMTVDQDGKRLGGKDHVRNVHSAWDLDLQRAHDKRGQMLHHSFNVIFSMPSKTAPDKLLEAVQAFASGYFGPS